MKIIGFMRNIHNKHIHFQDNHFIRAYQHDLVLYARTKKDIKQTKAKTHKTKIYLLRKPHRQISIRKN